jgi:hypothetical protein
VTGEYSDINPSDNINLAGKVLFETGQIFELLKYIVDSL